MSRIHRLPVAGVAVLGLVAWIATPPVYAQRPVRPMLPVAPVVPDRPAVPPAPDVRMPLDVDLHLDLDAIRESAREALASAFDVSTWAAGSLAFPELFAQRDRIAADGARRGASAEDRSEALYQQARASIDAGRYERAIAQLDQLVALARGNRADAALYWKSYTLAKQGQRADALNTLADLQKRFAASRWLKDARALEMEIRQASGQPVSPDAQNDEELKLLALRGLMLSDPDRAVPMIEKLLGGTGSVKLRENALFVLSQSPSPKAREIIAGVAKSGNPDLQLRAIRYLGVIGGADARQVLDEVYRTTPDPALKRAVIRSLVSADDRPRLAALARSEPDVGLRGDAVQQLGVIHAAAELGQLYQTETSADVRKRIVQALFVAGASDKLMDLARNEKDPQLRRAAIRNLGLTRAAGAADALKAIYGSDASAEVRQEVINALYLHQDAAALVALARAEKDPMLKKDIVQKLSSMKSPESTDFLLELLK